MFHLFLILSLSLLFDAFNLCRVTCGRAPQLNKPTNMRLLVAKDINVQESLGEQRSSSNKIWAQRTLKKNTTFCSSLFF